MKNFLKNLVYILIVAQITSCSNDDNGNIIDVIDPIIGNWEYVTQFENDVQTTVNDCNPSTIEFTEDGNRTDLYFWTDNSGECVVVDTVNMIWVKLNDGTYQFTQSGFILSDTATFENENNTLILEDSDSNGSGGIDVYRFIYARIN